MISWLLLSVSGVLLWRVAGFLRLVSGLTLVYSWCWALAACLAVTLTTLMHTFFPLVPPGLNSAAELCAGVMLLTPAVALLGARNPGAGAWQCFVVTPLIFVLQWPMATQLFSSGIQEPLTLGGPALIGIVVVVIMSLGPGLGTTMSIPTLLYLCSIAACLAPVSGWVGVGSRLPLTVPVLLLFAELNARWVIRRRLLALSLVVSESERIDQVWGLFQDLYGIVWARRVQDRVNQFAPREHWGVLLTPDGFRKEDGKSPDDHELSKPLEAFRWVLQRFATAEWLNRRLYRLR